LFEIKTAALGHQEEKALLAQASIMNHFCSGDPKRFETAI
jgi:hypothetical protein